ncbi:hypothetical protein K0M31_014284 [Melipona bicolor]|uniref:Uncharacterized protein n=1 Tax=Melipona bicolor TaxID=60889 RepID=A0AA40KU57_9HYME|nr:hypothetical protein K0M31_014284 [Melipona bicolor]
MVGGVIKDPRLRPCELSEQKRTKKKPESERKKQTKKKKKKNRKNIAGVGPGRPRRRLRLRGRGKKAREPAGQRVRRQPVTNLTLNQLTCAPCSDHVHVYQARSCVNDAPLSTILGIATIEWSARP